MNIEIPHGALVVLVGPSGAGKSTFASKHFSATEVISSDVCRGLVSDDENDQTVSREAFELVRFIAEKRLALHRLTVIDATSVRREDRKMYVDLARKYHVLPVAVVFDINESICHERNANRPDRDFGPHVVRRQVREMRRGIRGLQREGFRYIHTFSSPEEVERALVERTPLWTDRTDLHGPFDIIGDIHGCFDELIELLTRLGYRIDAQGRQCDIETPAGRTAIFLGDFGDRGPRTPDVYRLVEQMVREGVALAVPGNHDVKLGRHFAGRNVRVNHGLRETLDQFAETDERDRRTAQAFIDGLVSHYVLDGGRLVVAHAGLPEELHGRSSRVVRETALYGVTTGRTDDYGLPERVDWAADYRGEAAVVYGHTPVGEPVWRNGTINIDTGCVFGGSLTALRYPERETVSIPAHKTYFESPKPFQLETDNASDNGILDISAFTGRRSIQTRLVGPVVINEQNSAAALETMARFAIDPRLLIYLPPTMSPPHTSKLDPYLEHPSEAFAYYRERGIGHVVCETKHMGSRAIFIVARDIDALRSRFGVERITPGIAYTRAGRRFFNDAAAEQFVIDTIAGTLEQGGFWSEFATDWVALDCEVMPWSLKAQGLIRNQYAAVGTAGRAALNASIAALEEASARGVETNGMIDRDRERLGSMNRYIDAYQRYIWDTARNEDIRVAPFQILATEGKSHLDEPHDWQMETLDRLTAGGPDMLFSTEYRLVDLLDSGAVEAAVDWWAAICASGGEGIVVKPREAIARAEGRLIQPAMKVRGPDYLRIVYGPDYDRPEFLNQFRRRSNGRKQGLAAREFALGVEAVERFVRRESIHRVHECVFGVLALESEPVDPRL